MMESRELGVRNIALIGMMGSGKTSVGKCLADRLGWGFVDLDHLIEIQIGTSVQRIFEQYGESYFRCLEERTAVNVLLGTRQVIATGGGAVKSSRIRAELARYSLVVWLVASPAELARRAALSPGTRPLLVGVDPEARLEEILRDREQYYKMAHVEVNTEGLTPEQVAERILEILGQDISLTSSREGADRGECGRNGLG